MNRDFIIYMKTKYPGECAKWKQEQIRKLLRAAYKRRGHKKRSNPKNHLVMRMLVISTVQYIAMPQPTSANGIGNGQMHREIQQPNAIFTM